MIKKIKTPTKNQLDQIMEIWLQGNLDAHNFINKQYWLENFDEVKKMIPNAELYIEVEHEQVIGFAGVQDDYISGVFVQANHRYQGIGTKLFDQIMRNHDELTLSVYQKNSSAIYFYNLLGFDVIEQKIDTDTDEIELLMKWKRDK